MSTETYHLGLFLFGLLCTVMSFATWILAAINIRRNVAFNGDYNKIDPATLVLGMIANVWFLGLICLGHHAVFKAKITVAYIACLIAYVFGIAVAYAVLEFDGPNNCPSSGDFPVGCQGRYRALIAFTWTDFGLFSLYFINVCILAGKHKTLPWTNRQSGWNVPVDNLCPLQDPTQIAEEKAAAKNSGNAV